MSLVLFPNRGNGQLVNAAGDLLATIFIPGHSVPESSEPLEGRGGFLAKVGPTMLSVIRTTEDEKHEWGFVATPYACPDIVEGYCKVPGGRIAVASNSSLSVYTMKSDEEQLELMKSFRLDEGMVQKVISAPGLFLVSYDNNETVVYSDGGSEILRRNGLADIRESILCILDGHRLTISEIRTGLEKILLNVPVDDKWSNIRSLGKLGALLWNNKEFVCVACNGAIIWSEPIPSSDTPFGLAIDGQRVALVYPPPFRTPSHVMRTGGPFLIDLITNGSIACEEQTRDTNGGKVPEDNPVEDNTIVFPTSPEDIAKTLKKGKSCAIPDGVMTTLCEALAKYDAKSKKASLLAEGLVSSIGFLPTDSDLRCASLALSKSAFLPLLLLHSPPYTGKTWGTLHEATDLFFALCCLVCSSSGGRSLSIVKRFVPKELTSLISTHAPRWLQALLQVHNSAAAIDPTWCEIGGRTITHLRRVLEEGFEAERELGKHRAIQGYTALTGEATWTYKEYEVETLDM